MSAYEHIDNNDNKKDFNLLYAFNRTHDRGTRVRTLETLRTHGGTFEKRVNALAVSVIHSVPAHSMFTLSPQMWTHTTIYINHVNS